MQPTITVSYTHLKIEKHTVNNIKDWEELSDWNKAILIPVLVTTDAGSKMCIRDRGSITIDEDLLDAANMIPGEKVYIADNNNGERFETYIIPQTDVLLYRSGS